jgi:hypothetical protein
MNDFGSDVFAVYKVSDTFKILTCIAVLLPIAIQSYKFSGCQLNNGWIKN